VLIRWRRHHAAPFAENSHNPVATDLDSPLKHFQEGHELLVAEEAKPEAAQLESEE
jgi:hypothetical protein